VHEQFHPKQTVIQLGIVRISPGKSGSLQQSGRSLLVRISTNPTDESITSRAFPSSGNCRESPRESHLHYPDLEPAESGVTYEGNLSSCVGHSRLEILPAHPAAGSEVFLFRIDPAFRSGSFASSFSASAATVELPGNRAGSYGRINYRS